MAKPERGRGRPPKDDEDKRTNVLRIRLTEEERALLDSSTDGMTSTWAREILLKQAKKQVAHQE